jgi:hypothetical protein
MWNGDLEANRRGNAIHRGGEIGLLFFVIAHHPIHQRSVETCSLRAMGPGNRDAKGLSRSLPTKYAMASCHMEELRLSPRCLAPRSELEKELHERER